MPVESRKVQVRVFPPSSSQDPEMFPLQTRQHIKLGSWQKQIKLPSSQYKRQIYQESSAAELRYVR